MKKYMVRIMNENRGNLFLPGSFFRDGTGLAEVIEYIYKTEGFQQLGIWMKNNPQELKEQLDLLENCIMKMYHCQEYLIDPFKMEMSLETFWISTDGKKEIRIQYQERNKERQGVPPISLIQEFVDAAEDPVSADYLQMICNRAKAENPGLRKLRYMILQIKRDLAVCGWIEKNRAL